jgi:hypothetical protein
VYAQPTCNNCRNSKYPYIGCCDAPISGQYKCGYCTNNPSGISGFRPLKKCNLNNSIINYIFNDFPFPAGLYSKKTPSIPIITIGDTRNDIDEALLDWILACDTTSISQVECDSCPLKIFWTTQASDMKDNPNSIAITRQIIKKDGTCHEDCDSTYIALNATPKFIGSGASPLYNHFFYTNPDYPDKNVDKYFHFKSIILHEIGHWLGFGDINETGGSGDPPICVPPPSGSNITSTVMWGDIKGGVERDVLSDIDKCMFMLLYCCAPMTDIEEEAVELQINLEAIPNPANNELTVKYFLPPSSNVNLYLFDIKGSLVAFKYNVALDFSGANQTSLDISGLSSGSYSLVLNFDNKRISKIVVINR